MKEIKYICVDPPVIKNVINEQEGYCIRTKLYTREELKKLYPNHYDKIPGTPSK